MSDFIKLESDGLSIVLAVPWTYYQGTRFDWAGVFRSVEYRGQSFCEEWFEMSEPFRHDNVCGPSEEFFGTVGYEDAAPGKAFIKIGVGMLERENEGPYDWFHRYKIVDPGKRTLETSPSKVVFTHEITGRYSYRKCIEALPEGHFKISHSLRNIGIKPLELHPYCHNFFTFGLPQVGRERSVEFNTPIKGEWREDSVNAVLEGSRIRITSPMTLGQKAYLGKMQAVQESPTHPLQNAGGIPGYAFTLRAGERSVHCECDRPLAPSVLWSNHRVFCPEPYLEFRLVPGETARWTYTYSLNK